MYISTITCNKITLGLITGFHNRQVLLLKLWCKISFVNEHNLTNTRVTWELPFNVVAKTVTRHGYPIDTQGAAVQQLQDQLFFWPPSSEFDFTIVPRDPQSLGYSAVCHIGIGHGHFVAGSQPRKMSVHGDQLGKSLYS